MFLPFFACMSSGTVKSRSKGKVTTRGDEVTLNAEKAACCGGPQTLLNQSAVSCPYAGKGTRGQVQLRLPNLARTPRKIWNL